MRVCLLPSLDNWYSCVYCLRAAAGSWRIADSDIFGVRSGNGADEAVLSAELLRFLPWLAMLPRWYGCELEKQRWKKHEPDTGFSQ